MGRVDYNPDHIKSVGELRLVFVLVTPVPGWGLNLCQIWSSSSHGKGE